ncbi:MAG TPA: c-type cytochrome [Acetobacteraceae bacterium]|nr:c-type cytochrome [Acetobacteraceae bacterium]
MKQTILISGAVLIAVGVGIAQGPAGDPAAGQANGAKGTGARGPNAKGQAKGKGAPRNPAQSPAARPGPRTVTPQTYPAAQIRAGEGRFTSECGFCHGRDATGGETGPDLTRSELVAEDVRGDKIGPLLRKGRPDQGMPAFDISNADVGAIVAFVHDLKTKSEALGGGRQSVAASDLATGNAADGRSYFNAAGGCSGCHTPTGDLAGIATRYNGLALLQRMLYPTAGRPTPARPNVTVTLASGETVAGPLASEDEFTVVVTDAAGTRKSYEKSAVKYKIDDPMSAHFDLLGKYTDADMHNVYAYLDTLK